MGGRGKIHRKDAKGAKVRANNMIRALSSLIAIMLAAASLPLRAGEPVDAETLQLAQRLAVSELDVAVPYVMRWYVAEQQMPRGQIGTHEWAEGVAGLVSFDLRGTNPGRETDVAIYIERVLIPEMEAHHDAYICGYTRLYYSQGKNWI